MKRTNCSTMKKRNSKMTKNLTTKRNSKMTNSKTKMSSKMRKNLKSCSNLMTNC